MKQLTITCCLAALVLACNSNKEKESAATPTENAIVKSAATSEAPPDSATMMKNFMEYATPGKEHQMLASWDGTWSAEVTMWMRPDAPPTKSTATAVNKMIMGGRYQQSEVSGSFEGMPFTGVSLTGFDNVKKVFVSTWIDNMGTGIMKVEGPWDEATKTITFRGKMVDPSIKKEVDFKEVLKVVDDHTQVLEMYAPMHGGKEFKNMEIRYTRKK